MNIFSNITRPQVWFMPLLLATIMVGCGSGGGTSVSTTKAIVSYSLAWTSGTPGTATGTITGTAIAVTVPTGTDVTALVATFTTTGASVKVGTGAQTSGATPNDFTTAKSYIVMAADGSTATYSVTVTVAAANAKAITSYSLAGVIGTTSGTAIAVTVPNGTNVSALIATFTTTGSSVTISGVTQNTGAAPANNFASPVTYRVMAADSSFADYMVTVTVAPSSAKAMTSYSLLGSAGTISGASSPFAVAVTVPNGTNVTALVATFATTGNSVTVAATGTQVSGVTSNNFTNPVAITVHAADGTTAIYNVTVTTTPATVLPGIAGDPGANVSNPTVNSASPSSLDTNVPTSTRGHLHTNLVDVKLLTATFNEVMDPTTINSSPAGTLLTFTLKETVSGNNVPGTVAMNTANTVATFKPTANLSAGTGYTATISTAAKNAGSITAMPAAVAWSFTTRAASALNQAVPFVGQAPIDLLSAGNFVILAQTAITDVTASAITGDIGVSTTTGASITVPCADMVGTSKVYDVDGTYGAGSATCAMYGPGANKLIVDQAVLDTGTASLEAANRSIPDATELVGSSGVATDIGGMTIYPGLYKWSTGVLINSNLTLDAQGDSNAVWIFQISGDLVTADSGALPGVEVILTGKAKASNIFWLVIGSSLGATIGTHDTFNGNILSSTYQARALTGAVVNGRLFAATQVVLQQNVVTQPAP